MEYRGMTKDEALAHVGVKGSKWGYNKGSRNGKRTAMSLSELEKEREAAIANREQTEGRQALERKRNAKEVAKRNADAQSKGRAERDRQGRVREAVRKAAGKAAKAYASSQNRKNANSKDAASIRSARKSNQTASRKKRNRQLNRIDGLNAKQGSSARRQIATYYNRRNRKNLKNA